MCPSNKWLCALSLVCSRTQRLCWTRSLWLQRTADRVKSLDTCAATIYKHSINWNVGMLGLVPFLCFSLSLFLSFSLSLFLSLFLFLYVSLSLFISFSRSLSLSLSRYPPAHPNNTTMASCMRAVAAVVHVAPFAAPHSDTVHPVWNAILFSSSLRCSACLRLLIAVVRPTRRNTN